MKIWFAALLGALQGVTEFLPVSSSGHLAVFQRFFGLHDPGLSFFSELFDLIHCYGHIYP